MIGLITNITKSIPTPCFWGGGDRFVTINVMAVDLEAPCDI